jgi:hypothetical protein
VAERLAQAVAQAVRRRDRRELVRLERAVKFVSGGHSAGEAMLVERLADAAPEAVLRWVERAPAPTARPEVIEARLTGIIVFEE